jgi:hypothetical protein
MITAGQSPIEADAHIFAQVRQAVARRDRTLAFHVAGPPGTREVTETPGRTLPDSSSTPIS